MALADIYVVDLRQSFNGEPIHNMFTFERGEGGSALGLVDAFIEDIVTPHILGIQCTGVVTESVYAYSLGNLGDLWEQTVNEPGTYPGEMLPIFNAVGFTLKSSSRAVRPGSKRFAGVPEAVQVDGVITEVGYLGALELLRVALGEPIEAEAGIPYTPVIVKRVKYDVPDSDPVREAYRYPIAGDPLVTANIRNVLTNTKVKHQVSRGN